MNCAEFVQMAHFRDLWPTKLPRRFGANPGEHLVLLAQLASREIYAACGMHSALFGEGDAASTREAWRLLLFGVVAPLGRKVETELQRKLEDTVTLEWGELRASDIQGRAGRSSHSWMAGWRSNQRLKR